MVTFRQIDDVIQNILQCLETSRGTLIVEASNSAGQYTAQPGCCLGAQQRKQPVIETGMSLYEMGIACATCDENLWEMVFPFQWYLYRPSLIAM